MTDCLPLVSVVVPAYNASRLIGKTIESVLNQTFSQWELIVVDDCSTDGTREVVSTYAAADSRIRLIPLEKNYGGPAGPRNFGVNDAAGKWIAFLDADDIWHPRKLEVQLTALRESGANFACSRMRDFSQEDDIDMSVELIPGWEDISFYQQALRARVPTSSVIASKNILLQHPFVEHISYKAVEDYHCWLRLLKDGNRCIKLNSALLFYRKIEGQISGSKIYMMGRVFMVHRNFPGRSWFAAGFLTLTHVMGGLYFRFLKKGM